MTADKCDKSTKASQCFPLPLTDFEHYAFHDDSPEHPMVIVMRTLLEGPLDVGVLQNAIRVALQENPLLHSTIDDSRWTPRWKQADHLEPSLVIVDCGAGNPSLQCAPRTIDLTRQTGVHFELRRGADRSDKWADTQTSSLGFGCWLIDVEQVGHGASGHRCGIRQRSGSGP